MENRYRPWWLLLFVLPYFIHLGASSIWDINEAFYVEAPREMMQTNDFVTPRFNYHFRLEKPILSYWVILPFYYGLGPGEFAERLPMALSMVLTLGLVYRLGSVLFDPPTGLFGALAFATSFKVFWLARRSIIDMLLLLCVSAAIYFAIMALRAGGRRARWYTLFFYGAMALGTLAKGLLGVILPGTIVLLYLISQQDWAALRRLHPLRGLGFYLLICAPWYVVMFLRHGWSYLHFFFGGNHVERFLYGSYSIARPIWFYVPILGGGFFPWSLFLLPALIYGFRAYARGPRAERSSLALLAIWFVFIFGFFSLARAKQEEYILQLYPACALGVGYFFSRLPAVNEMTDRVVRRAMVFSTALAVILFGFLGVAYFFTTTRLFADRYIFNWVPMLVWVGSAALLAWGLGRKRARWVFPITAGATLAFLLCLTAVTLPDCERYRPVRALAAKIRAESRPTDRVGYYRIALPSLCFYTGRPIFEISSKEQLQAELSRWSRVFCLMDEPDYQAWQQSGSCPLYVLESRPKLVTTLRGFQAFWNSGQLPPLLLVSNQPPRSDYAKE